MRGEQLQGDSCKLRGSLTAADLLIYLFISNIPIRKPPRNALFSCFGHGQEQEHRFSRLDRYPHISKHSLVDLIPPKV
jgi:hypothetical protein